MSLRTVILNYIAQAKRSPAKAGDPAELAIIEKAANDDDGGAHVATMAPNAIQTFDIAPMVLHSADTETPRQPLTFPSTKWEVLGFSVSLVGVHLGGGALRDAVIDDLDVKIDVNNSYFLTSVSADSTTSAGGSQFVTLRSVLYDGGVGGGIAGVSSSPAQIAISPRVFRLEMTGPNPNLGFTFRWRLGTNVYNDVLIALSCACRSISQKPGAAVAGLNMDGYR